MFDKVDTPFSYGRGLIVCSLLQKFSKTKESTLHVIGNVDTAFVLCGADLHNCVFTLYVSNATMSKAMQRFEYNRIANWERKENLVSISITNNDGSMK